MTHDPINSPSHYAEGRRFEPIDVIEDWKLNFRLANTVKYISRAGRKKDILEDLRKARWYLDREIYHLETEQISNYVPDEEGLYDDVLTYYGQTVDEKEAWPPKPRIIDYGPSVNIDVPEPECLRIYELAHELGVSNKVIFDAVDELGIKVKSHASSLKDGQVEEVRTFLDKQVPFEATEDDWADFWDPQSSLGDDVLWDPSVGPVELSEKEIADILARKTLDQFQDAEIVATIEKRGFILGIKKDGSTCELGVNGRCV